MKAYITSLITTIAISSSGQISTLVNGHGILGLYEGTNCTYWTSDSSELEDNFIKDGVSVNTDSDGQIDIILGKQVAQFSKPTMGLTALLAQNIVRLNPNTLVRIDTTSVHQSPNGEIANCEVTLTKGQINVVIKHHSNVSLFVFNNGATGQVISTTGAEFSLNSNGEIVVFNGQVNATLNGASQVINGSPGIRNSQISNETYWEAPVSHEQDHTQTYISPTR